MDGSIHDVTHFRFHRSLECRSWDNRERNHLAYTYREAQLEATHQHPCMSIQLPFLS